jgi:hypothetical protein
MWQGYSELQSLCEGLSLRDWTADYEHLWVKGRARAALTPKKVLDK